MKKLFALLFILTMILSLAACGGGGDSKTPSDDNSNGNANSTDNRNDGADEEEWNDYHTAEESTPPESGAALEAPLYGWKEEDIKPENIFDSMTYEDGMGYFITTTEPLTADTYKAWYRKIAAKVEEYADNGEYIIQNVTDLEEYLSQAIEAYENKTGSSMYLMWEYTSGGQKIGITTMVVDLEKTEEVLYFYIHKSNN